MIDWNQYYNQMFMGPQQGYFGNFLPQDQYTQNAQSIISQYGLDPSLFGGSNGLIPINSLGSYNAEGGQWNGGPQSFFGSDPNSPLSNHPYIDNGQNIQLRPEMLWQLNDPSQISNNAQYGYTTPVGNLKDTSGPGAWSDLLTQFILPSVLGYFGAQGAGELFGGTGAIGTAATEGAQTFAYDPSLSGVTGLGNTLTETALPAGITASPATMSAVQELVASGVPLSTAQTMVYGSSAGGGLLSSILSNGSSLAPLAGAILGGTQPTSGSTTSTTSTDPRFDPYINQILSEAQGLYNKGNTYAPPTSDLMTSWDIVRENALNGDPSLQAGGNYLQNLLSGGYMRPETTNPYMDNSYIDSVIGKTAKDMTDAYSRGTAAQNDAMFARNKAYGGSAWQEMTQANQKTLADAIGAMSNQARMQDYNNKANLWNTDAARNSQSWNSGVSAMNQGASLAPNYNASSYYGANILNQAGNQQTQSNQNMLNTPYQNLSNYSDLVGNLSGKGTTSTSQPWTSNQLANIISGATGLNQLWNGTPATQYSPGTPGLASWWK